MEIKEITKEYLSKFKVYESPLLFDTDYSLLKEGRCPLCMNKLRIMRNNKLAFCPSKKHKQKFICDIKKINKN